MRLSDFLLLVLLAAIWGSSFIFMRATVESFGPILLIAIRVGSAALCLFGFLLVKSRLKEFIDNWRTLCWIGLLNSAVPFSLLAYASISLSAGMVSVLNGITPLFTAATAHLWLKDKMNSLQLLGLFVSMSGVVVLVWDKISWESNTLWPVLAGVISAASYGVAANGTKKYLQGISSMTATAGSLFFASLFMLALSFFFLQDMSRISTINWVYVIVLGVVCTAIAYIIFFKLIHDVGPSKAVSVTFLIPAFSFLWAYLLLDEKVTIRMWVATAIILFGTSLVTGIIKK